MSSTQKIIKYLAIAFAISLIASICMGIYQLIGSTFGMLVESGSESGLYIKDYSKSSKILSIDIGASKLKIVEGDTLKVESNNKYIKFYQDKNRLSVTERNHSIFNWNYDNEVIIYIPKETVFDKVYISTGAGTVDIENISTKDLELELGAGKLDIEKITTYNETEIEGGAGKVTIRNASLHNLDLDAGVGKFTLYGSMTGETNIDAGVGELNINLLDSEDNYSIYTEAGLGSIKINNDLVKNEFTYGTGNNKIDIDGGIGSINITFNR